MTTTLDSTRMDSTPQLAADLGHLLDRILSGGEQDLLRVMAVHEMTPLHVRVLRELAYCPMPLTVDELADRIDLDVDDVQAATAELRRRRLVMRRDAGTAMLVLTPDGRRIVSDVDEAHRADLSAYVGDLDRTGRRRLEAALSLLDER